MSISLDPDSVKPISVEQILPGIGAVLKQILALIVVSLAVAQSIGIAEPLDGNLSLLSLGAHTDEEGVSRGEYQMNNLYFACRDCKIYIDAGYRWAYWELEEAGVVVRKKNVDVEAVLAAVNYWSPPQDENSRWLYEKVFPPVREFLHDHRTHHIVFGEEDDFAPLDDDYFDWMQVGYLLVPTPRYLVEVLGLRSWDEVREYMGRQDRLPAWWEETWSDHSLHEKGKHKFEELVRGKYGS